MRHLEGYKRLGRNESQRKALLRNLAQSIVEHERITTTLVKAKAVRTLVERMITLAKRGDLHARRQARQFFYTDDAVTKLFGPIADRFKTRPGGYTRIIRRGIRVGDSSRMAIIELLSAEGKAGAVDGTTAPKKATAKKKVEKKAAAKA